MKIFIPIAILWFLGGFLFYKYSPDKSFETFFYDFCANQRYQISSVKMPIDGDYTSGDTVLKWDKRPWIFVDTVQGKFYEQSQSKFIYASAVLELDSCGSKSDFQFKVIDKQWRLIGRKEIRIPCEETPSDSTFVHRSSSEEGTSTSKEDSTSVSP